MANLDPYKDGDRWYIDVDPDDIRIYVGDVSAELTNSNTTASSCVLVLQNMIAVGSVTIQGGLIATKLQGNNMSTVSDNLCTFRVTCANGEQFDKTIYFKKVDK
jgi:hypothetical protein